MSQNRRKRSRNRNRATTTDVKGQTPQKPHQQKRNEPKVDPVEFWGDPAALPEPMRAIAEAPDPEGGCPLTRPSSALGARDGGGALVLLGLRASRRARRCLGRRRGSPR